VEGDDEAMTAQGALTEQDVVAVRGEAAVGRPVTVWFTAAAVGVPAGGSAKVVAVGDVAEGDFIQVRPAGSRDTMFCSPNELTRTKPPRRRAAPRTEEAGKAVTPLTAPPTTRRPASVPAQPADEATGSVAPPAPRKPKAKAAAPAESPAASAGAATRGPVSTRRRADRSAEMTVSLTAKADGEWSVEVLVGTKRVVPSVPVQAADVAAASRSLPPAVAEVITSSLEGARQRQRERVEQLRAELDAAQRALDQLDV
jgi:hypothetical protein